MQTVADVMTPFLRTVREGHSVAAVRDLMAEEGVHAVPIVDNRGGLRGIISATDLVEGWSPSQTVDSLMNTRVRTISPLADTATAAQDMLESGIHHLVVADGDEPIGMVSSWDLLRSLARAVRQMTAAAVTRDYTGDELIIDRPEGRRHGRIVEVHGLDGRPPYDVTWQDDPDQRRWAVTVVPRDDFVLERCER